MHSEKDHGAADRMQAEWDAMVGRPERPEWEKLTMMRYTQEDREGDIEAGWARRAGWTFLAIVGALALLAWWLS